MNVVRMKKSAQAPTPIMHKPAPARLAAAPAALPGWWQTTALNMQRNLLPPVLGLIVFIMAWAAIAAGSDLPSPLATWHSAVEIFSDPFYSNGPNDQGIGWNVLNSLARVGIGFGLAALIGIPFGFLIGYIGFLNRMMAPIISVLRPVS